MNRISLNANAKYFLSIIFFSTILLLILQVLPLFNNVNNLFVDPLLGETNARSEVVIVGIDDKSLQEIGSWPWDRTVFANALENISIQKPAAIGIDVLFLEERSGDESLISLIETGDVPVVLGSKIIDQEILYSIFNGKANVYSGFVNFSPDLDGKIRNTRVFENINDECEISFGLALASQYFKLNPDSLCSNPLKLRSNEYVLNSRNELQFSYTRERFAQISFADVLNNNFSEDFFKDKMVLIGSTALDLRSGLNDNFTNIFGDSIPGVEIHANILNSFLQNSFFKELDSLYILVIYLVFVLIFSILSVKVKKALFDFLMLLGFQALNFLLTLILINFGIIFPFVQTALFIFAIYIFNLAYKYLTKSREYQFIKTIFSRYLNKDLLNVLMQSSDKLKLGGETKNMTVLFSDIRSFTSISESLSPQQLVSMLNEYLSFMTEIILKNKGTVDKYIGDAIVAFWNAPLDDLNHYDNALKASIEMKEKLDEFVNMHPEYPEIKIGIGINSGEMVVGNIGGVERFDYTVLGDNVNLGSRLEGLTKNYKVTIIVSESVVKGSKLDTVIFRMLDNVRVKGRKSNVKIYEPMVKNEENEKIKSIYEEAFNLYQDMKFDEAIEVLNKNSNDKTSEFLIEKINILIKNPPKDWDGVWKWDEK